MGARQLNSWQSIRLLRTYPQGRKLRKHDFSLTASSAKNIIGSLCSINIQRHPAPESWGSRNEKNLPAESHQARQDPRISRTHGHAERSQGPEGASGEGASTSGKLIFPSRGNTADERFPRQARLRRPRDFRHVFAQPTKSVDNCFTVLARGNGCSSARLGLAISKKCAPRAVDRNRLKRIIRESFRRHHDHLEGIDLVVMCRRGSPSFPNSRLYCSLCAHWKRLRDQLCASC